MGYKETIFAAIEFVHFFEVPRECGSWHILSGINPVLHMTFTFMQMYYLFMHARQVSKKLRGFITLQAEHPEEQDHEQRRFQLLFVCYVKDSLLHIFPGWPSRRTRSWLKTISTALCPFYKGFIFFAGRTTRRTRSWTKTVSISLCPLCKGFIFFVGWTSRKTKSRTKVIQFFLCPFYKDSYFLQAEHPEEQNHRQVWSDAPARHQLLHLDSNPRQVRT